MTLPKHFLLPNSLSYHVSVWWAWRGVAGLLAGRSAADKIRMCHLIFQEARHVSGQLTRALDAGVSPCARQSLERELETVGQAKALWQEIARRLPQATLLRRDTCREIANRAMYLSYDIRGTLEQRPKIL